MKAIFGIMLNNPKREHFRPSKATFIRFPSCIIIIDVLMVSSLWPQCP